MDKFFGNLHAVLGAGLVLAIILMLSLNGQNFEDGIAAGNAILRWLHTFFGVLWIGLLYYFNFVQKMCIRDRDQTAIDFVQSLGLGIHGHADARGGLVDQVDGLVGQEAILDVAVGEVHRGHDLSLIHI